MGRMWSSGPRGGAAWAAWVAAALACTLAGEPPPVPAHAINASAPKATLGVAGAAAPGARRLQEEAVNASAANATNSSAGGGAAAAGGSGAAGAASEESLLDYVVETPEAIAAALAAELAAFRSAKCEAMHEKTCIEQRITCMHWDMEEKECLDDADTPPPPPPARTCFYGESDDGLTGMPYLLLALLLGCGVTTALTWLSSHKIAGKKMNLPFTVVMFLLGYMIEWIFAQESVRDSFPRMGLSVQGWVKTHPHIILFVLLPPLLFEDSTSIDYHVCECCFGCLLVGWGGCESEEVLGFNWGEGVGDEGGCVYRW